MDFVRNGNRRVLVERYRTVRRAADVISKENHVLACRYIGGAAHRNHVDDVVARGVIERHVEIFHINLGRVRHSQIRIAVLAQTQVFRLEIAVIRHVNVDGFAFLVCRIQLIAVGDELSAGNIDSCV